MARRDQLADGALAVQMKPELGWSPTDRLAALARDLVRLATVTDMPAPRWFWRLIYDRESASWVRRRDQPEHREPIERRADQLARVVPAPGPVADLGCGPGAHARALARRGYDVTALDGSPQMIEVARNRAASDGTPVRFAIHDVRKRLPLADKSLGGALAILVIQRTSPIPAPS